MEGGFGGGGNVDDEEGNVVGGERVEERKRGERVLGGRDRGLGRKRRELEDGLVDGKSFSGELVVVDPIGGDEGGGWGLFVKVALGV